MPGVGKEGFEREPPDELELEEVRQEIERELGLDPEAEPIWGYLPPVERLFDEEADTQEARRLARSCLFHLRVDISRGALLPGPVHFTPADVERTYQDYRRDALTRWTLSSAEPFPDYSLQNVLGATKRQIAWLTELKHFQETDRFDQALEAYSSIQGLIMETLPDFDA